LHSHWVVAEGFFGYNSPKPKWICMKPGISMCALAQKWGKSPQGFYLRVSKCVCFFLSCNQYGLLATYLAPISSIFEIKYVNWCSHAYAGENFSNFCAGGFPGPPNSLEGVILRGVFIGVQLKRQNFE